VCAGVHAQHVRDEYAPAVVAATSSEQQPSLPESGGASINRQTLSDAVRDTHGRLVIAEDHRPEGGLGSAVLEALAAVESTPLRLAHLAVRVMPRSGTPTELLAAAAIDAAPKTAK
jgi:Transketolase, C-terminal domain